jgi:hypothetical protein
MATQFKRLRNIAAGIALTVASAAAYATPGAFVVDPTAFSAGGSTFTADQMAGTSSARISQVGNTFDYTGTGYIQYTSFTMQDVALNARTTGINLDYLLYATFTQNFSCSSLLSPGTSCSVTGITLSLWADVGANNQYTKATLRNDGMVTNTLGDVKLGEVNQVVSGSAGVTKEGGAFQSVNTNFALTEAGSKFFISPTPFYTFAFSSFNNTTQGLSCAPSCNGATTIAINNETGNTDFNAVPEPMPLALMGLGMLGMVAFRRKQAKK